MKTLRSSILVTLALLFMVFHVWPGAAAAAETPMLTADDCIKCHSAPPADLAAAGGKHKDVGCTGCHIGHPPTVKKPIPKCNDCHMGKSHFELKNCLGCHKNPHTPKKISFPNNITDACLTCHTPQIEQLKKYPSKHTQQNCSFCHDVHGKKPACTQCHQPHASFMNAAECLKCHKPHMPTMVAYPADIPSKDCGACHANQLKMLTASKVKHATFACAFCHQDKHKTIPKCQDCHGIPHPEGIMAKFPKCGECHKIAHDLNNWTAADTVGAPQATQKTSSKATPKPQPSAKKKKQ